MVRPKLGVFSKLSKYSFFCCFFTRLVKKLEQWSLYEVIEDILPFVLNTKRPLSNIWLLRYEQNSAGCFYNIRQNIKQYHTIYDNIWQYQTQYKKANILNNIHQCMTRFCFLVSFWSLSDREIRAICRGAFAPKKSCQIVFPLSTCVIYQYQTIS